MPINQNNRFQGVVMVEAAQGGFLGRVIEVDQYRLLTQFQKFASLYQRTDAGKGL